MSDFETHEIGTAKELKLSRTLYDALARAINNEFGDKTINPEIITAHNELRKHYLWQTQILDQL